MTFSTLEITYEYVQNRIQEAFDAQDLDMQLKAQKLYVVAQRCGIVGEKKVSPNFYINKQIEDCYLKIEKSLMDKELEIEQMKKTMGRLEENLVKKEKEALKIKQQALDYEERQRQIAERKRKSKSPEEKTAKKEEQKDSKTSRIRESSVKKPESSAKKAQTLGKKEGAALKESRENLKKTQDLKPKKEEDQKPKPKPKKAFGEEEGSGKKSAISLLEQGIARKVRRELDQESVKSEIDENVEEIEEEEVPIKEFCPNILVTF